MLVLISISRRPSTFVWDSFAKVSTVGIKKAKHIGPCPHSWPGRYISPHWSSWFCILWFKSIKGLIPIRSVVKLSTIQIILSLAITNRWPRHQLDVDNAISQGTDDVFAACVEVHWLSHSSICVNWRKQYMIFEHYEHGTWSFVTFIISHIHQLKVR